MIKRLYFSVFTLLLMALSLCSCNQDALKALKLSHESITLAIGSSITLEVIHIPIEATPNNKVSWKSSNPNVARVDSRGKVTPLYTGTTVITAYCGTIEAKCTVTVSSLNYDVQFSHAMAYIYGDQDDVAANHVILRLFQESLSVDATGTITGQGIFLNIDLYLPFDKDVIPTGIYSCSELPLLNTCLQGALLEVGDAAYATGTYLGEFHENGLGALFLTQGQIDVTAQDGQYIIKVELTGDRAEKVNTLYQGAITFVDNSDEEELETVDYLVEAIHYFNYGDRDSLGLNVARMQIFNREGHMIRLDAYVPLAIKDTLPMGTYTLAGYSPNAFRLIPPVQENFNGCWINDLADMTMVQRGSIRLYRDGQNQVAVDFSFYDTKNRLFRTVKPDQSRMRIK